MRPTNEREIHIEREWVAMRKSILTNWRACDFWAPHSKVNRIEFRRHVRYSPTFRRLKIRVGAEFLRGLEEFLLDEYSNCPSKSDAPGR